MHFNGFTASPARVHNTVEFAGDVRKFLELKLRDFAGYVINMLTMIDQEKENNFLSLSRLKTPLMKKYY